jgi:hypothetical protein
MCGGSVLMKGGEVDGLVLGTQLYGLRVALDGKLVAPAPEVFVA